MINTRGSQQRGERYRVSELNQIPKITITEEQYSKKMKHRWEKSNNNWTQVVMSTTRQGNFKWGLTF